MQIRVLYGLAFCDENSKLYQISGLDFSEIKNLNPLTGRESRMMDGTPGCKLETATTLNEMYATGWILKTVTPYRLGGDFLFFFEHD